MRAVICVPWRGGEPTRERNWSLVGPYLEATNLPVYTGDSDPDKPFNRSQARNRAAAAAGEWDVALFCDADTLFTSDQMLDAITWCAETGGFAYPCDGYVDIDPETGGPDTLSPNEPGPASGSFAIHRDAWLSVGGGFDERLSDYGYEDIAIGMLLAHLVADPHFGTGTAIRLGHARTAVEAALHPEMSPLIAAYQSAWLDRDVALGLAADVWSQRP